MVEFLDESTSKCRISKKAVAARWRHGMDIDGDKIYATPLCCFLLGVGCWLIVFVVVVVVVVVVVLHCWMCLFTPSNEGPQWVCCSIFQTKFKIIFLQIPSWIEHVCRCTLGLFIFIKGHLLTFKSQWGTGCTQCVRWETPQPRRHKDHYTWSNYSWWREIPSFEKKSGWWNVIIWPWHNFCRGSM